MPDHRFRALSALLGRDPLQVQGPGGNTSLKVGGTMWIKASGTCLSDALEADIFVAVDRAGALDEAHGAGDGTCRAAVIGNTTLRPSIETTFHALLDHAVVAHTHSVATLVHAICPEGRAAAMAKLGGLPAISVPYAKPGLPLTQAIATRLAPETTVVVLENHGLICAGPDVATVRALLAEVERRLHMPVVSPPADSAGAAPPGGHDWLEGGAALATGDALRDLVRAGTYWPDHAVFLGPALPTSPDAGQPAILIEGAGIALRNDATDAQRAMARCMVDVFTRLPRDWRPEPIGPAAEAALLDWDAEKYRQALAARDMAAPDMAAQGMASRGMTE